MINIVSIGIGSSRIFECFNPETNDFVGIIGDIKISEYSLIKDNVEKMVTECLMKHKVTPTAITNTLENISVRVRSVKNTSFNFPYLRFQVTIRSAIVREKTFQGYSDYVKDSCLNRYTKPYREFFNTGIARIRTVSLVKPTYQTIVDNLK